MAHIVTDFGLVDLGCESSLRRNTVRPVSYLTTLGGVTKAQVGPRTSRVWDLSLPSTSTPDQYAALNALVEGEYGKGPWGFVSDGAKVTNLLTPSVSRLSDDPAHGSVSGLGGPMRLPDGSLAGGSWVAQSGTALSLPRVGGFTSPAPVVPGGSFTASVFVADAPDVRLRVWLYDAAGGQTRTLTTGRSSGGEPQRLVVSGVAADNEVSLILIVDHVSLVFRVARPAVSWASTVQPWAVGEGATSVLITEADLDTVLAVPGRTYGKSSFMVREVG